MCAGLVLLGYSFEDDYHYMVTAVAWALFMFGTMITIVTVNAYNLDSYPEASGETSAWLTFGRTTGGFIISYLQVTWAEQQGTKTSFGIQASLCVCGLLLMVFLQIFGKKLRVWSGDLGFRTV